MEKLEKILKRQSTFFLIISLLFGALLIIVAVLLHQVSNFAYELLLGFGSSIFGVSVGLVIGSMFDATNMHRIWTLLQNTLTSSVNSNDDDLNFYRRQWHHYFQTVSEGTPIWRYRKYNFDLLKVPGKLMCTLRVPPPAGGEPLIYRVEGFLVGLRLIFVQTSVGGAEPPIIQMFPHGGEEFRRKHAGVSMLRSWDGSDLIVPVILTEAPLTLAETAEGTLNAADSAIVAGEWRQAFNRVNLDLVTGALHGSR